MPSALWVRGFRSFLRACGLPGLGASGGAKAASGLLEESLPPSYVNTRASEDLGETSMDLEFRALLDCLVLEQ